jgi:hypothetical protein
MLKLASIISLLLFGNVVQAQTNAEKQAQSIRLTQGPQMALDFIEENEYKNNDNGNFYFEKGVSLSELGLCRSANTAFEKSKEILKTEAASFYSYKSLEDNCFNILPVESSFGVSFFYDTNYNNGTENETVIINGLPFTLSDDLKPETRYGLNLNSGYKYNHLLGWGEAISLGLNTTVTLTNSSEDNSLFLSPNIFYLRQMDHSKFEIGPFVTLKYEDEEISSKSVGLHYSTLLSFKNSSLLNIQLDVSKVEENDSGKGTDSSLNLLWTQPITSNATVNLTFGYLNQNRTENLSSLTSLSAGASLSGNLTRQIGYEFGFYMVKKDYKNEDPIFQLKREDTLHNVYATATFYSIETMLGHPYLGISKTSADSNISLNQFDKTNMLFGFTKRF